GLQTHGRTVGSAHAGQRTAVNLAGIDHSEVARGQVLAAPSVLRPTQIIDSRIELLAGSPRPLRSRQRVRVHIGTAEVLARVAVLNDAGEITPGERGDVQLRLETPVACRFGDRFILRSYSPQQTIGGGEVLDPHATRARKRGLADTVARLELLAAAKEKPAELVSIFVAAAGERGLTAEDINARLGLSATAFGEALGSAKGIKPLGGMMFETGVAERLSARLLKAVGDFHIREPLAAGMPRETLREAAFRRLPAEVFAAVAEDLIASGKLASERDLLRLASHRTELSAEERAVKEKLSAIYKTAGLEPPKLDEALASARGGLPAAAARKIFEMLIRSGEVTKVTDEYYFSAASLDELTAAVRKFAETAPDRLIDVAKFKELAGISRKFAIPLLEHFDRSRVTRRAGDKRLVL
ncbi:MAG TPA: SelB C-terminal domain-containing protein, partial [Pyrinomonadaceae bacterium]|nr:SelB C-terminal domain-containing protein [Pyrinomonadaceae bacterium]